MDRSAIGFSVACALHCLCTPFVLIMLPALVTTPLADEIFHQALIVFVLPMSILALLFACRKHQRWSVLIIGMIGLAILTGTALWGHDILGESGERVATLVGAFVVTFAHVRNAKFCTVMSCHKAN